MVSAVALFGILIRGAGLYVALPASILLSSSASKPRRPILAAGLAIRNDGRVRCRLPACARPADPRHRALARTMTGSAMSFLDNLGLGFETALSLTNLLYCFIGVLLGTAIGVLPGLGPVPTIAMLLPITFGLEPTSSLIMLAGIFYGAQYGGSTTAILINVPGEFLLGGHGARRLPDGASGQGRPRSRDGRARLLLRRDGLDPADRACSAAARPGRAPFELAGVPCPPGSRPHHGGDDRRRFRPALHRHGRGRAAARDSRHGRQFRHQPLHLRNRRTATTASASSRSPWASSESRKSWPISARRDSPGAEHQPHQQYLARKGRDPGDGPGGAAPAAIGSALGLLPGGGALLASFASYALEKRISRSPERFGHGAIEGVAGPESANNAGAQTSFIPMLTLGLPSNPVMALMVGAMIIQGIQPGPKVMTSQPARSGD